MVACVQAPHHVAGLHSLCNMLEAGVWPWTCIALLKAPAASSATDPVSRMHTLELLLRGARGSWRGNARGPGGALSQTLEGQPRA